MFIYIGVETHTNWLPPTILRDKQGFILTGTGLTKAGRLPETWQLARAPLLLETSMPGVFAVGDVHGDIKLIAVAWAEGIQAAIYAFKEITSPYWLNEKRLRDSKLVLIGEKVSHAAATHARTARK